MQPQIDLRVTETVHVIELGKLLHATVTERESEFDEKLRPSDCEFVAEMGNKQLLVLNKSRNEVF